jgi:hypothetical protein
MNLRLAEFDGFAPIELTSQRQCRHHLFWGQHITVGCPSGFKMDFRDGFGITKGGWTNLEAG